jgi:putative FmdB family regulatory protein
MPIYLYDCLGCEINFTIKHGMSETCEECPTCGSDNVSRIPTSFTNFSTSLKRSKKVGDTTKEFIENAKQELKIQKEELEQKR